MNGWMMGRLGAWAIMLAVAFCIRFVFHGPIEAAMAAAALLTALFFGGTDRPNQHEGRIAGRHSRSPLSHK